MNGYRKKELKRLARREAAEERERVVEERRARITPEAQAKLRASIADLKQRTNGRQSVVGGDENFLQTDTT
jgi:hypothetical protein